MATIERRTFREMVTLIDVPMPGWIRLQTPHETIGEADNVVMIRADTIYGFRRTFHDNMPPAECLYGLALWIAPDNVVHFPNVNISGLLDAIREASR